MENKGTAMISFIDGVASLGGRRANPALLERAAQEETERTGRCYLPLPMQGRRLEVEGETV